MGNTFCVRMIPGLSKKDEDGVAKGGKTFTGLKKPGENGKAEQVVLKSRAELLTYLCQYKAIVNIGGFGSKQQYADVEAAIRDTAVPLFEAEDSMDARFGKGEWCACFGGDQYDEQKQDIAVLVGRLQAQYDMPLVAIQADIVHKEWGGVDKHIDAVYYYPTEYKEDGKTVAWGGLKGGRLVGATRVMLEVNPCTQIPLFWIATGGGDITLHEVHAAWDRGLPILCIPAKAKLPQDPEMPYGPCKPLLEKLQELGAKSEGSCGWRSKLDVKTWRFETRPGVEEIKVLVTGATGLLGREILREFEERGWDVYGTGFSRATGRILKCDLLNSKEAFPELVDKMKPAIVIHCAAERRPLVLKDNKEYAIKMNVELSELVAKTCSPRGIWVINVSTNYVFDGNDESQAPYGEDADPRPGSVYGESKWEAERAFEANHPDAATVRIPLLYGPIEYLDETSVSALRQSILKEPGKPLDNYQERYPTCTTDVARIFEVLAAAYLLRGKTEPELFRGVFHWQSNEMHTKFTMAKVVAEVCGIDSTQLSPKNTKAYPSQQKKEGLVCGRLEKLLDEVDTLGARHRGADDRFRSDFKASMAQFMRPFLPKDMLNETLRFTLKEK